MTMSSRLLMVVAISPICVMGSYSFATNKDGMFHKSWPTHVANLATMTFSCWLPYILWCLPTTRRFTCIIASPNLDHCNDMCICDAKVWVEVNDNN